jgi:hypothetical protein
MLRNSFYLTRLAVEWDRMEYLLTGENRFEW